MDKFIPYSKLSKKKRQELDNNRRQTWGGLNPVTRKSTNPKAYNRQKARKWNRDDFHNVPSAILFDLQTINYRALTL